MSKGVTGMSPQSRIVYGEVYGFRPRRGLKPRKEVWRAEAALIARGPKRAPGRFTLSLVVHCSRKTAGYMENFDKSVKTVLPGL